MARDDECNQVPDEGGNQVPAPNEWPMRPVRRARSVKPRGRLPLGGLPATSRGRLAWGGHGEAAPSSPFGEAGPSSASGSEASSAALGSGNKPHNRSVRSRASARASDCGVGVGVCGGDCGGVCGSDCAVLAIAIAAAYLEHSLSVP